MDPAVSKYIESQPQPQRSILEEFHRIASAEIPGTTDKLSYGIIGFTFNGKVLVFFGGWKKHVSIYGGREFAERAAREFQNLTVVQSTIQVSLANPISESDLKRLLRLRMSLAQ